MHTKSTPTQILLQLFTPEAREIRTLVLFAGVVGLLTLVTPLAVESLVNTVAFVGLLQPIIVLAIMMMTCLGLAAVILTLEAYIVELIQRRIFVRVVATLSRRLPRVRRAALDGAHGPELANRFLDLPTLQKGGAKLLLDGVTVGLSAAVGLVVLAFYHPLLLAFGAILTGCLLVVIFILGRGAVRTAVKESSAKFRNADWIEQIMRHPDAFQTGRGPQIAADHADEFAGEYLSYRCKHYRVLFRQLVSSLGLQVLMSTMLLGLGGWLVTTNQLTLGQLVAAWLIMSIVLAAVTKLGAQLESLYDVLAACGKLGMLLDLPVEREDGQNVDGMGPAALTLTSVSHTRVTPADSTTVDTRLRPGDQIAIRGPGGSGKSTLVELMVGYREPEGGRVDYDGVNLRSLDVDRLREQVIVARPGDVISATVAENVTLGRFDLGLYEIQRALREVGLWGTVQTLPDGLETELTSFGPPLSSTHADQLVLARAIATRPRLLVVDGLLDRLDGAALERALDALLVENAPWTLIVATQRESVAARFDRVLELAAQPQALLAASEASMSESHLLQSEASS